MGIKDRKKNGRMFYQGIEADVNCYPLDYTGTARRYATCLAMMHLFLCTATLHRCTWCVQFLRSPKEAFAAAMQSWRERREKCVCLQGDYVEK